MRCLAGFSILYAAATLYELISGPTPWHPAAGLAFALFLFLGPRGAPAILAGAALAAIATRGRASPLLPLVLDTLATTIGYGLATTLLRLRPGGIGRLGGVRAVGWFAVAALAGSLAVTATVEALLALWGLSPLDRLLQTAATFWVRDAIGILTLAPPLLLFGAPWCGPRPAPAPTSRRGVRPVAEAAAQGAAIALVLWVNLGLAVTVPLDLYYLCLLPLLWIALRRGLPGAVLGTLALNAGASIAVRFNPFPSGGLAELQMLMLALAVTGLFLGATVSARQETAADLRAAKEAAEAADRAKGSFLANVSHELRTPMNSILGYTQLVLDGVDGPVTDEQRSSLERVNKHAIRLLGLIDDLIDFATLEERTVTPAGLPFRLRDALGQALEGLDGRAREKGLKFGLEVAPELPDRLAGDARRLGQVVRCLVERTP